MKIVLPSVKLEFVTPEAEKIIEAAGRTCYKSEQVGEPADFVKMIIRRGHESVLEHPSASFRIVCDRGVSHEIVRHRLASYSQESTRYCNYSKNRFGNEITVIEPPGLAQVVRGRSEWRASCERAEEAYFKMMEDGCHPQIARSVLPTCLKTELVMTCNFREWRHFLKLRTAAAAHPQMREVAGMIAKELAHISPACFGEFL